MLTLRARRNALRVGLVGSLVSLALWQVLPVGAESGGYRHLGAVTSTQWHGVVGRLAVTDPGVRAGTYDFVAARFMAKEQVGGDTVWLEAGWSENGWRDGGPAVYTYDSASATWSFYDAYRIAPGDRIWIYLDSTPDGEWAAWLWWDGAWRMLRTVTLPTGADAQIEEFVEVYADPRRAGTVTLPATAVDNVALRTADGGSVPWRAEVDTATADRADGYCLDWRTPYDTWSAATC
ncbi:MAG: hypothetical protein ACRDT4_08550 [Micromonosporaceae bacterium]